MLTAIICGSRTFPEYRERATAMDKEQARSVVFGRNAVTELLQSSASVDTVLVSEQLDGRTQSYYTALARQAGAVVKRVPPDKLQALCDGGRHQGVAAYAAEVAYAELQDLLDAAAQKGQPPFLLFCDGVEDPYNLGALMRSALLCGAHGIVIPKRGSASVSPTVMKASAGAAARLPVARVTNLGQAVRAAKDAGVFVYCADMDGVLPEQQDFSGAVGLVVGSEGKGVSAHIKKLCDGSVRLAMAEAGGVDSFNVSVAGGILLYEVFRRRYAAGAE